MDEPTELDRLADAVSLLPIREDAIEAGLAIEHLLDEARKGENVENIIKTVREIYLKFSISVF